MRLNTAGTSINTSLYVSGLTTFNNATTINSVLSLKNDVWHQSNDNIYRLYYGANGTTYICSGGVSTDNNLIVYSSVATGGYYNNLVIQNNGNTTIRGTLNSGAITTSGAINLNGDNLQFPSALNQ